MSQNCIFRKGRKSNFSNRAHSYFGFFSCPDHTLSFHTYRYRSASVEGFGFHRRSTEGFRPLAAFHIFASFLCTCAKSVELLSWLGDWVKSRAFWETCKGTMAGSESGADWLTAIKRVPWVGLLCDVRWCYPSVTVSGNLLFGELLDLKRRRVALREWMHTILERRLRLQSSLINARTEAVNVTVLP